MKINRASDFLVSADQVLDHVPVISAFSNLIVLFQKCVILPLMKAETIEKSHYYTYIKTKSCIRCVTLITVIGFVFIALMDASDRLKDIPKENKKGEKVQDNLKSLPPIDKKLEVNQKLILNKISAPVVEQESIQHKALENKEIVLHEVEDEPLVLEPKKVEPEDEKIDLQEVEENKPLVLQPNIEVEHKDEEINLQEVEIKDEAYEEEKKATLEALERDPQNIHFINPIFYDDKEIALAFVKNPKNAIFVIQNLSSRLRDDIDIGLALVKTNFFGVFHLSGRLKKDKAIGTIVINANAYAVQYLDASLRDDLDLGLLAVKKEGLAVQYLSPRLQDDKEIGIQAVKQNANAVGFLSSRLRDDKEIGLIVTEEKTGAFYKLSPRLQNDRDIMEKNIRAHIKNKLIGNI